jgi:hypothetical protein
MVLSQSAATAAALAIDENVAVQDLDYQKLRLHLLAGGQILGADPAPTDSGILVDNTDATGVAKVGDWTASTSSSGYWGADYVHDGNTGGGKSVTFTPDLPSAGAYEVFVRWTASANRATNVPIDVIHASGTSRSLHNQQANGGAWISLGTFDFAEGNSGNVVVGNDGANGYVITDAVRFLSTSATTPPPMVHGLAGDPSADETDGSPGVFRFVRDTDTLDSAMTVLYSTGGTAVAGSHYQALSGQAVIPAGKRAVDVAIVPIGDSIAQGPRTVSLTLQPNGSAYSLGTPQSADVVIYDKPFDSWRHAQFSASGQENAGASDPDADPDSDGLVNQLEFLLGGDPLDGEATGAPTVELQEQGGTRWLAMTYWRRGEASAWNPAVQFSDSLAPDTWNNAPGTAQTLFHDPNTGDRLLRHAVDATNLSRIFLRLSL